ncbi:peroxiredoxin [Pedobacter africanus]|uniref:Peroxiredoxin n=1 Tax=Pedobacter africanus TaxID=151894 RepID=A0ACC6L2A4_9SPHI|nr:redoxin domain-containing protein [Pedobacter africanus]MDR6785497.1 peroxiredoxin [Pedobacter africanus]
MKNILKNAIALCFFLPLIAQGQLKHFTLNGKLAKVPPTAMAYLVYTPGNERKIDSVRLLKGAFIFKGNIEQATSALLLISPHGDGMRGKDYSSLQLYLEPGNILLSSPDKLSEAKVMAGQVNADNDAINLQLKPIAETEKRLRLAFQMAEQEKKEEIARELELCEVQRRSVYRNFITHNPDHMMSFFALKASAGSIPKAEVLVPLFDLLGPAVKRAKPVAAYGLYLQKLKAVMVGAVAPEFKLPDTSGKMVSLSSFRGKYVLIDFWASWCKPCREENPNLIKARQAYKDLTMISISLDYPGTRKAWTEAIKKDRLEWTQLSELGGWDSKIAKAYFVKAIPQNFLIGPDGRIVAKDLRGGALQQKLGEIYKQNQLSGKFTLNGKVGNFSSPAKAFLMYTDTAGKLLNDSTVIQNGHFSFSGIVDYPKEAWVIFNTKGGDSKAVSWDWRNFVMFYLEPGTLTLSSPDTSIARATITGGPVNKDNEALRIAIAPFQKQQNDAYDAYYAASKEEQKSRTYLDAMDKVINKSMDERKLIWKAFVQKNPSSFRSIYALQFYGGPTPDVQDVEPLFNSLSPEVKASKPGIKYARLMEKMKTYGVGAMAPDFTQADTEGKAVSLRDFRGKYVLIDFWASWCGPCRAENPNVVNAYQKYKDKNFTILGVSLDRSRENWLKAIKDDKLVWTQVSDLQYWKNEVAKLYAINAIPQNVLVDPKGKIVGRNLTGGALTEKLEKLLGKM